MGVLLKGARGLNDLVNDVVAAAGEAEIFDLRKTVEREDDDEAREAENERELEDDLAAISKTFFRSSLIANPKIGIARGKSIKPFTSIRFRAFSRRRFAKLLKKP